MANRQWDQNLHGIAKLRKQVFAAVAVPAGTTPVLQKYNFPQLGVGGRTLSAAATASAAPLGYPQNYQAGSEGVYSVARTAQGLWTFTFQDNYQRLLWVGLLQSVAGGAVNIVAVAENPSVTSLSSANGSVVGVGLLSATGALADPTAAATTVLRFQFLFGDATEP